MKRNSRKQTTNQREYAKQVKRLKQAIRRAEKRGYVFDENVIPDTPKRVTQQSIKRLQQTTTKDLYKKSIKVDYETGEFVTGTEARKVERQAVAKKAQETRQRNKQKIGSRPLSPEPEPIEYGGTYYPDFTDIVLSQYKAHIRHFNDEAYTLLSSWLDRLIASNGEDDVAEMLNTGAENGNIVTYQIVYSRDAILEYISSMLDYLPEAGDFFKEEMLDAIESMDDWESPD